MHRNGHQMKQLDPVGRQQLVASKSRGITASALQSSSMLHKASNWAQIRRSLAYVSHYGYGDTLKMIVRFIHFD